MTAATQSALVSSEWLAENLDSPDLRVVDATYYLPSEGKDARAEFEAEHIPGAVFFDIDAVSDPKSPLPHMLPDATLFSSRVRKLGLGDGNRIVVYDRRGMMSAPRVWWSLKLYGHKEVYVLDGGLNKWKAEERPLDDHPLRAMERHFTARMDRRLLREVDQIEANLSSKKEQVLDARSAERFAGSVAEPREGLRSGHIPGSLSLPWTDLVDPESKELLKGDALRDKFLAAGVDLSKPVVTSCGSGVTACVLLLGLHELGQEQIALYDGSWSEWGQESLGLPIETGEK